MPIEEGQRSIRELDIELVKPEGFVLYRRTKLIHAVKERQPDGSWRTSCGSNLTGAGVLPLGSTKPFIGYYDVATGDLIGFDYGQDVDYCFKCTF